MSDARWIEVFDDMNWAATHFSRAAEIFELGGFEGKTLEAYKARMAFMQAMQAGHTSLEGGLERILQMLGEEKPAGGSYHADLIKRAGRAIPSERPAILAPALMEAADETRRFRHVARKSYNDFRPGEALHAVAAAQLIASRLIDEVQKFRDAIDPDTI